MRCNVCNAELGEPLFKATSEYALTSLCELRPGRAQVWFCEQCGHLLSEALPNIEKFYAEDYRILLDHEDEDQIYEYIDGRSIYRTEHQIKTLLKKIDLVDGALMLDYGCAKATTPKQLLEIRSDIKIHLFDVSGMYVPYWEKFVPANRCAVDHIPDAWKQRFDLVTSFFSLEHMTNPIESVQAITSLLKRDGLFYGIVPNTFSNPADFIVVDHVNHFTASSLHFLLRNAGFNAIEIDDVSHRGALIFSASLRCKSLARENVRAVIAEAQGLAEYWSLLDGRIRSAEQVCNNKKSAIYGSGFYGAYIASSLKHLDNVQCFLDRSPFQQGKSLFNKPILAPEALPLDIEVLYVGLNPGIARKVIDEMAWLSQRNLKIIFLDGADV